MARPGFKVEMTIGVPSGSSRFLLGDATDGKLGTSPLGGIPFGSGTWADLSTRAMGIDIVAGRQRLLDQDQAGRCTITFDNSDRALDPTDLNGPYVDAGVTLVRPMAEMRVTASVAGSDFIEVHTLFHGTVDSFAFNDSAEMSTVSVSATDGFKLLERVTIDTVAAVGAGETEGQRVTRILDAAGWSATLRDIDDAGTIVAATTHGQTALAELRDLAASTLGRVFMDDNTLTYRSRHWRDEPANSNILWTFTDQATAGYVQAYSLDDTQRLYDDDLVVNYASVTASGSTAQIVQNTTSQGLYGVRSYPSTGQTLSSVLAYDADALSHATRIVEMRANPELRFDRLTMFPDVNDPTASDNYGYRAALGLEFDERVYVVRTPPKTSGVNAQVTRRCFVEGWHHQINPRPSGGWRSEFQLSDAESWPAGFVLGTSLLGTGTLSW